jgi:hypothetical protein
MSKATRQGNHSEFRPQERNANGHTDRGMDMLASSIEEVGWIGAITVAADGEVFDGSARHEVAGHLMPEDAVVIDHDGTKAVYIRRTDIPTAKDPRAIKAGILANRTAEVNLDWQCGILQEIGEVVELGDWFTPEEMAAWDVEASDWDAPIDDDTDEPQPNPDGKYPIAVALNWTDQQRWAALKVKLGFKRDQDAFVEAMDRLEQIL